jgi:hypothetical protein
VPGLFRVAPDDGASRYADLAVRELGRLLRIAQFALRPDAEIGFRAAARAKIDAVRMDSAVDGDGAEDRARMRTDQLRLRSRAGGWAEIFECLDPYNWSQGRGTSAGSIPSREPR